MEHALKNKSGASIIEIMITLLVITITTMLIMSFSRSTVNMSRDARAKDAATIVAEQKIVDLSKMCFTTYPQSSASVENITLDNIAFTRTWKIEQNGTLLYATVTVEWGLSENHSGQITLAGVIN